MVELFVIKEVTSQNEKISLVPTVIVDNIIIWVFGTGLEYYYPGKGQKLR